MDENDRTLLGQQLNEHAKLMEKYLIENIADVGQAWDEIRKYARWCWCEAMKLRDEKHRIVEERLITNGDEGKTEVFCHIESCGLNVDDKCIGDMIIVNDNGRCTEIDGDESITED